MDVDPETTSSSEESAHDSQGRDALSPTGSAAAEGLLKGRYALGVELGHGGFAVTYLATDLEVASRKVVVKILHESRARDSWALKKFQSEMEALARIDHPNVVSIIDFGYCADGKPFLVMQYIPGQSLRKFIPRDGLPLAQAAHVVKQIGRALTAAHEAGVCHRDLKPENIMLQTDGHGEQQIKLIDFGIATIRDASEDSASTTTSGSYAYMAPEQFHGRSSFATDVYQMGVVAFELVTGIRPFRARTPAGVLMQHTEGLRLLPKDLRPDLPEAAQDIILKAIAPQPENRYQNAREFGDELAAALAGDGTQSGEIFASRPKTSSQQSTILIRPKPRIQPWLRALIAAAILAAVCTTAYFIWRSSASSAASVAVLPFENRTGDPELAYLTEGVTESLINDLSHIPTLRVIARGAVLKYGGTRIDPQAAGRQLGVTRIIDGSISRNGDQFDLDTELIDVRSGVRVWGYAYSAKASSLTEVLQQFSTEVTDQLRLKLSGPLKDRLKRQYAVGSESYQDYLKGRFHLNKRTPDDFQEAIHYFNQAIGADSEYAPAYSGLADTYVLMASFGSAYGGAIPITALQQARRAAERALQLDGTLAEAYAARGFVEMQADYKWDVAERDFRRSIELNPSWPDVHEFYSFDLGGSGRFEEAVRELKVAADLEPDSLGIKLAQGLIYHMAGRQDESLSILRKATNSPVGESLCADFIAEDYWAKSMPNEALEAVQRIPLSFTPHLRMPLLAAAYARAGEQEKARAILKSYVIEPDTAGWYYLALAHLSLHQTENALDDLEHAYEQRYEDLIWLAVDPMLQELRMNPRFRALLQRTGRQSS